MKPRHLQLASFLISVLTAVLFCTAAILYLVLRVIQADVLAGVMAGLMLFLAVCWGLNFILIVHTLLWKQMSQDEIRFKVDSEDP